MRINHLHYMSQVLQKKLLIVVGPKSLRACDRHKNNYCTYVMTKNNDVPKLKKAELFHIL